MTRNSGCDIYRLANQFNVSQVHSKRKIKVDKNILDFFAFMSKIMNPFCVEMRLIVGAVGQFVAKGTNVQLLGKSHQGRDIE